MSSWRAVTDDEAAHAAVVLKRYMSQVAYEQTLNTVTLPKDVSELKQAILDLSSGKCEDDMHWFKRRYVRSFRDCSQFMDQWSRDHLKKNASEFTPFVTDMGVLEAHVQSALYDCRHNLFCWCGGGNVGAPCPVFVQRLTNLWNDRDPENMDWSRYCDNFYLDWKHCPSSSPNNGDVAEACESGVIKSICVCRYVKCPHYTKKVP